MIATSRISVLLVVSFLGGALLTGCHSTEFGTDAWPTQPYFGGDVPAKSEVSVTYGIPFRSSGTVTWTSPDGRTLQGKHVANQIIDFLRDNGYVLEGVSREASNRLEIAKRARMNPLSVSAISTVFERTVVLVSLDPQIILISDVPVATSYASDLVNAGPARLKAPELVADDDGANPSYVVGLPGGIIYGRQVPVGTALLWASPTLAVGPTPIPLDDLDGFEIAVPWGSLTLRSQGDLLIVQAFNK